MPPLSLYAAKTIEYNLTGGEMDADINLKIIVGEPEIDANPDGKPRVDLIF